MQYMGQNMERNTTKYMELYHTKINRKKFNKKAFINASFKYGKYNFKYGTIAHKQRKSQTYKH